MSKSQRDKGARREREIVNALRKHGIKAEKVPLSGAAKFRNTEKSDVDCYVYGDDFAPWIGEVKARGSGKGFTLIKTWLGENDALYLIEDRADPLVVLPWERWIDLLLAIRGRMR
jgi:predicted nucleotidyltransferase